MHKMKYKQKNKANDVNGASLITKGSVASGRSGCSKATQVVNQRNPCKNLFNTNQEIGIGTWNVRTMFSTGQLDVLPHQVKDLRWGVMGLCETRWTGAGEFNKEDIKVIYAGRKDEKHKELL